MTSFYFPEGELTSPCFGLLAVSGKDTCSLVYICVLENMRKNYIVHSDICKFAKHVLSELYIEPSFIATAFVPKHCNVKTEFAVTKNIYVEQ